MVAHDFSWDRIDHRVLFLFERLLDIIYIVGQENTESSPTSSSKLKTWFDLDNSFHCLSHIY